MNRIIEHDGVKYEMHITECKKTQLPHVADEAEYYQGERVNEIIEDYTKEEN